jgi:phosphoglycerate dehydrogenase-like enzyme
MLMRVVFHGANARLFRPGVEAACSVPIETLEITDDDRSKEASAAFADARVIVGVQWQGDFPTPKLELYHVAAAGYDRVEFQALPPTAAVCNCFGHEPPIAEYAMLAALRHVHPLEQADRALRKGEWLWCAQVAGEPREELTGRTIGILGFGHIGREIARKARAFDLEIVACNRSPVPEGDLVDLYVPLEDRHRFYAMCDVLVVSLPLLPETAGFVDADAFASMPPSTFLINVGRGPVIDEEALFDALENRLIAGAAIDTWYDYPGPEKPRTRPSRLPFHELENVLMTPHLSGWTTGTIQRRAETIARNIENLAEGRPLENLLRGAGPSHR